MEACNSLLAVVGTGMLRPPGTVRGPALALAAFCAASSVAKSAAGLRWPAASCAGAGKVSTRVRAIGMTPESDTTFIGFPPSAYTWPELLGVRLLAAIEVTSTVQRAPAGLGGGPPDAMSMRRCHRHDEPRGAFRAAPLATPASPSPHRGWRGSAA